MNWLIGDIGGTNCRLAVWNTQIQAIENLRVYSTAQFDDLTAAVVHFKAEVNINDFKKGCVAIANPIDGDLVSMTNTSWSFSIQDTRQKLKLENLKLINDWESIGYAVSAFTRES